MNNEVDIERIAMVLDNAIATAAHNSDGEVANYIPELKTIEPDRLSASIMLIDGSVILKGSDFDYNFTIQSVSKLVLLIGMMEEFGSENVFSWIKAEPSGQPFASIGYLASNGPIPSNPLINSGAICLSGRIPGSTEERLLWVKKWINRLFGAELKFSNEVYNSEFATADLNRSLAYLMKSTGILKGDVEEILKPYFSLCSYTATIAQAAYLPMLLANGGVAPDGQEIISENTSNQVVSIMATCGLYNESGMHLVKTGLPAKSGVSGLIIAVGTGRGGIAAYSPRINEKGTSVRGGMIVNQIAEDLDWHFAAPRSSVIRHMAKFEVVRAECP